MANVRPISSLTGLRGVAALAVALFHFRQQLYPLEGYSGRIIFDRAISRGWHGVDLFFMLSGLLLMHVHDGDFVQWRKSTFARFAWLRFTRIYPLNTVALMLLAVFIGVQPGFVHFMRDANVSNFSFRSFIETLTLTTRRRLWSRGEWNGVTWSLSLEVVAYLAFPALAFLTLRIRRIWICAVLMLSGMTALMTFYAVNGYGFGAAPVEGWWAYDRLAVSFISGVLVQRIGVLAGRRCDSIAPALAILGVAGVLLGCILDRGDACFNPSFAVLLLALYYQHGRVADLVSAPLPIFLGKISFPFYLVHFVPLQWIRYIIVTRHIHGSLSVQIAITTAWICGCIGLSTMLHRWVEIPAHAYGRQIASLYWQPHGIPRRTEPEGGFPLTQRTETN